MALKILEAHVPTELAPDAEAILRDRSEQAWSEEGGRFGSVVRAVIGSEKSASARIRCKVPGDTLRGLRGARYPAVETPCV